MHRLFTGLVFAGLMHLAVLPAQADNASTFGVWETEGGQSHVLIRPCEEDGPICGRLIWTAGGKRVGETILSGFILDGSRLEGGRIYDPRSGKSYKAKLAVEEPGRLHVKGCWFIFCGSQTWTRLAGEDEKSPKSETAD